MTSRQTRVIAALVPCALAMSSCSGGGGAPRLMTPAGVASPAPAPTANANAATVSFTFVWPARPVAGAASVRKPAYISPSIASLTISVDAATPIVENAPTPTGQPQSVTYTLVIAPGSHTLAIAEYDATNKILGRATEPISIVKGQANVIGFTLDGYLSQIAIVPTADPFLEGTLAAGFTLVGDRAQTFAAIPEDADGNRIINPGAIPVITTSSANSAIVDTDLGNDTFTLYAPAPTAAQTITAAGTNLDGGAVTTTFQADALAALYVANYTTQTIGVYDENGTAIPIVQTAFPGLQNPSGLAYVPAATPGTAGTLVVTQTADSSMPAVTKYDTAGNALALTSGGFAGTAEPLFLGYGLFGTTPALAVPNENDNTIQVFDAAGNLLPQAAGSFSKLDVPVKAIYDAHDADWYVVNLGSATVNQYTSTGTPITTGVSATYGSMSAALDTNNDQIYVIYQSQALPEMPIDNKPISLGPQLAMVAVFNEALAPVTQATGSFLPATTDAFYADILFDPYLKQFFITDAGDNKMVAFGETGTAVTLPTSGFANLSDPLGIALVP